MKQQILGKNSYTLPPAPAMTTYQDPNLSIDSAEPWHEPQHLQQQTVQPVPTIWHPGMNNGTVTPYMPVARVLQPYDMWHRHPDNPNALPHLLGGVIGTTIRHPINSAKWIGAGIAGVCATVGAITLVMLFTGGGRPVQVAPNNNSPYFVPTFNYQP